MMREKTVRQKILIIDDEFEILDNIAENLELADYDVLTATNGWAGIELAQQQQPHLILCDIMMPGLDGYGVLLELRSHAVTSHIPFIFLSARADLPNIRKGMNLGADDYITKPFRHHELLEAVTTRLNRHTSLDEQYQYYIDELTNALENERMESGLKLRLLSMISHDMRSGLSSILSSEQLLRNYYDQMTVEQRDTYFNRVERNVQLLLNLLDELLDYGQVAAGKAQLEPVAVDMGALCQQIVAELQDNDNKIHRIFCAQTPQIDYTITGDRKYLQRILTNLLTNAIKYSPEHSDIQVTLERSAETLRIKVTDQGIGIPEETIPYLFDLYHRARNVGSRSGKGLGLAIVKQAVDLHGGSIQVESSLNRGTTFTVELPQHASFAQAQDETTNHPV